MEEHPDLTLAFHDYLVDQHDGEDVGKLAYSDIEHDFEGFPKHAAQYEEAVQRELQWRFSQMQQEKEAAAILDEDDDDGELVLADNQELKKTASGEEYILETPRKSRVQFEQGKRYAFIDSLAANPDPLTGDDDTRESEDDTEPA
jgi:hypothetical protein